MEKEIVEIEGKQLDIVEAEFMTIKQSTVRSAEAGHMEMQQVGALSIEGDRIDVTQGASVLMRGETLSLNQSIGAVAAGNNTNLNFSFSPVSISAGDAAVSKSAVGIMAAKKIESNNSSSLLMIAQNINGNVTTLLDWRSAIALGAVAGGIFGLFSIFRRR